MKLRVACDAALNCICALGLLALLALGVRALFQLLPQPLPWLVRPAHQVLLLLLALLLRALARTATFGAAGFLGRRLIEFRLAR